MRVKKTTFDVSGFGGEYEDACQRMLWKGVRYLGEVQPPLSIWDETHAYAHIYGVLHTEGEGIKAFENAVMDGEDDVTGARHQAVIGHLRYIHEHGEDGWLSTLNERRPDAIYEWEGELMQPDRRGTS